MKKHILKTPDPAEEFSIIGISSHENDYRLSWAINTELGSGFKKTENYIFEDKKNDITKEYSLYQYTDEDLFINQLLLANKSEFGFLIPELRNIDFFLVVLGGFDSDYVKQITERLRKVSIVSTALYIDVATLKSKKNFNFSYLES